LYGHISHMVSELELEKTVDVVETNNLVDVADMDIFLYGPLRNDHFLPLLIAGGQGIPVLANEITGIEQFVTDGHTGFVVPVNEVKPMAELIIRLSDDKSLRNAMGNALKERLSEKFSYTVLAENYEAVFFPQGGKGKPLERAA
jgi:glycosyltransferase involved in cell wall biosynthesis